MGRKGASVIQPEEGDRVLDRAWESRAVEWGVFGELWVAALPVGGGDRVVGIIAVYGRTGEGEAEVLDAAREVVVMCQESVIEASRRVER